VSERPESEHITTDVVAKVARLARLELSPAEIDRMTSQLDGMLGHFADIDALDLSATVPMTQPFPLANVFRADVPQPCLDRDEVLAAAPDADEGCYRVPPILGDG